jgi:tRNA(Arg) A34 adenosine deaminase TadA
MHQQQLLNLEFVSHKFSCGAKQETKKRYYIVAKCYDKKGKLLSVGINDYNKTHPLQKYFAEKVGHFHREYLHAEIAAIVRCKDKKIYRITVERYDKHGLPVNAKPCPICQEAIKAFGIKIVEST